MQKMQKAIIGKKIGMTQIFDEAGRVVPVTLIQAGPCTVMQKKTAEKDGYEAVQLGYETVPERKLTQPELGHQKKAGVEEFKKVLKEFALKDCSKYEVGDVLKADVFAEGDFVDVTGISKGHGFQGVVKRHGTAIKRMTTAAAPSTVIRALWLPVPIPAVSSRAVWAPVIWAPSRSPFRT